MHAGEVRRFGRYVALGDSSTEGLDDPDGRGGYRGWSRRLAQRLADSNPELLYANLGVRGRTTRQVRDQQLAAAVAMRPDLATVFSGTNDVLARRFDPGAVGRDMEHMQRALNACGATVLTFTLPDLTPVMPMARWIAPRVHALNAALRAAAAGSGAILVDFAAHRVGSDRRLWSADRIHANAAGHARIAEALGVALGLPGCDDAWQRPLPALPPRTRWQGLVAESAWTLRYLVPWAARAVAGGLLRESRPPIEARLRPLRPAP